MSTSTEEKRYLRAVETVWSRLRGRPTVLSPRDFEIVDGWRRRGIPLNVVLEVLENQARRWTSGRRRSLAYSASAVEEAWEAVASGRAAAASPPRTPSRIDARLEWKHVLSRLSADMPLRHVLERLLAEADAGAAPCDVDTRLDEALLEVAPPDLLARAERETTSALAPFRGRMPQEEFLKTSARARADRLRQSLGLPRLSRTP